MTQIFNNTLEIYAHINDIEALRNLCLEDGRIDFGIVMPKAMCGCKQNATDTQVWGYYDGEFLADFDTQDTAPTLWFEQLMARIQSLNIQDATLILTSTNRNAWHGQRITYHLDGQISMQTLDNNELCGIYGLERAPFN